jgi:hypothetical protein
MSSKKTFMQTAFVGKVKSTFSSFGNRLLIQVCVAFSVFSLCFNSCSKEDIDAPGAIKELIARSSCDPSCPSYVDKYLWRNKTIYIYTCSGISCDCAVSFYDQQGEKITMEPGYYFAHFQHEAQLIEHVWNCTK